MKNTIFSKIFTSLLMLTLLSSCNKEESFLGLSPENNDDLLNAVKVDTFTLITTTVEELRQRTDNTTLALCGVNNDPIFGLAKAGFYTQIRLNANNLNFGDISNLVVDSTVLALQYDNFYGKKGATLSFEVHQLNETLNANSNYFHTDSTGYEITAIGKKENFVPNFDDEVSVNGVNLPAQLRIPIDESFAQQIIGKSGEVEISNNENFVNFIKGIRVSCTSQPSENEGNIIYFNLLSNNSKMTIYYRRSATDTVQVAQDFVINNNSIRYNFFKQNFDGTVVGQQLENPDINHQHTYVQSMGALKTKIEFPYIKDLQKLGKIAINKAELILPMEDDNVNIEIYRNHNRMFVVASGLENENLSIADQFESEEYYGGFYNTNNKTYTFNIGRHLHQIINEDRVDNGIFILGGASVVSANRTVLKSFANTSNKINLVLYYSEL